MTVFICMGVVLYFTIAVCSLGNKVEDCALFQTINQEPRFLSSVIKDLHLNNCELAMEAHGKWPWSSEIPWSVFLNDIVPYYVLTEPKYNYRGDSFFMDYMEDLAAKSMCLDIACIVQVMNEKAWGIVDPPIIYMKSHTDGLNSYGIVQTMSQHNGSCTALSVFLVAALRSIGVASRIAGVPHWNRGSAICPNGDDDDECGNHNWVEVFVPGAGWSFVDQRPVNLKAKPLNQSWFYPQSTDLQDHSTYNHSIYATSFARTSLAMYNYPVGQGVVPTKRFPMVWDWSNDLVNGWDVTAAYTQKP